MSPGWSGRVAVADHEALHHALVAAGVGRTLMVDEEAGYAEERGAVVRWGEPSKEIALYFAHLKRRGGVPALGAVLVELLAALRSEGKKKAVQSPLFINHLESLRP